MTDPIISSASAPTTDGAAPAIERHPAAVAGGAVNVRVANDRQRHLAQSLVYGGLAALVIAGCGLLLVGMRRRLW